MKRHLQKYINGINGDCFRTCIACIMNVEDLEEIPNFQEDGVDSFWNNFFKWLDENNLGYFEFDVKDKKAPYIVPSGYCVFTGKSNIVDALHCVVGRTEYNIDKGELEMFFIHNPNGDQINFLNGDVQYVGFIFKKFI